MKLKITKTALISIPAPKLGRLIVHDTMTPGLAVMITSGDARAFYVVKWQAGKMKWVRLGPVSRDALDGGLTIEKARSMVRDVNARLAAGEDPNAGKRAPREGATIGDLWQHYLQTYARPHKKASSVAEDTRNYRKHVEPWGRGKKLAEITSAAVKTMHTRIGEKSGKTAANRVLALLSGMFSKAGKDLGIDPPDNPAKGITRFAEKERDRVLHADELQRFMAAIEVEEPIIRDYLKVSLYTGARRSNVLAMRWGDISMNRATWKIPGETTKGGDPLVIALAPQVMEILRARPDDSPFVFPVKRVSQEQVQAARMMHAQGKTTREIAQAVGVSQTQVCRVLDPQFTPEAPGHMAPPTKAWERVLKAAGITERTTLHDLRRTFATWLIKSGANLTAVAAALGHKDIRTTQKHYAWADLDTVKAATTAGVNAIAQAAQAKPDAKAAS